MAGGVGGGFKEQMVGLQGQVVAHRHCGSGCCFQGKTGQQASVIWVFSLASQGKGQSVDGAGDR
jgi:hypothetical protein